MSSCLVVLTGKLSKDPEMRYTQTGKAVTTLNIPVEEYLGEGKKKTVWYKVSTWDKLAERCNEYLSKGCIVTASGNITTDEHGEPRKWEKDGVYHATLDINARQVDFITMKSKSEGQEVQVTTDDSEVPF